MELLIVLLVGVFCGLRYGATDLVAATRGTDAWIEARAERARMRHELALKRAERGQPTVGEAVAERIRARGQAAPRPGRRDRPPKPPGPFGRYRRELWDDMWTGAGERRRVHTEQKAAGRLPRQRFTRWAREKATGRRTEAWTARRLDRDDTPEPADAEWTAVPEPQAPPAPPPAGGSPPPDPPAQAAPDTPPTAWSTVTPIRKDQPMTAAHAEITSPEGALAFVESMKVDLADRLQAIETAKASLAALEVEGGPVDVFASMVDPIQQLSAKADEAAGYFQQHITIADHVRNDSSFGNKQYATGS